VHSPPHVIVIGNQKGGSGKSTFAMHIIVALLKAGKRVACFDLDLNQRTLTRYLANRREWDRKHGRKLELPDYYAVKERDAYGTARSLKQFIAQLRKDGRDKGDFIDSSSLSHNADLGQFISQLREIGRADTHDFVVIDTPSGVQHLSLIAHGMADTLITPINDSFFDLDVYWWRWKPATSNRSCRHTPIWFGARLRPAARSVVARPTGSSFGIGWNQSSQTISVKSL
jgi:chromosome partitioning protein